MTTMDDLSRIQAQAVLRRIEEALLKGQVDLDAAKSLGILIDRAR